MLEYVRAELHGYVQLNKNTHIHPETQSFRRSIAMSFPPSSSHPCSRPAIAGTIRCERQSLHPPLKPLKTGF